MFSLWTATPQPEEKPFRLRGKALPQVTITAIAGLVDVESFGGKLWLYSNVLTSLSLVVVNQVMISTRFLK